MRPQTAQMSLLLLANLVSLVSFCNGCFGGGDPGGRRGKALSSSSGFKSPNSISTSDSSSYQKHRKYVGRIRQLNRQGDSLAITPNLRLYKGDHLYGRLEIPWDTVDWTLTITALWEEKKYSTPLWMYLKKSGLPDEDDFDKVSISYISRHYSRIRMDHTNPGPYYVMVEGLSDIRNLTLAVSVAPSDSDEAKVDIFRPAWTYSNSILP